MNETAVLNAAPIDTVQKAWVDAFVDRFVELATGKVEPPITEDELRLFARIAGNGSYDVFKNDPPDECAQGEWEEWLEASR
ncbi:hypothetical protein [Roseococcus pinisoli]|uniref:Uncharacterized protein n=1 Tax=Roseococcus pinisoli TaxID=2835040 RepID=A0ABS5QG64_9PROT|nr:hypothetical protein [Roseococcus pinisoli]MBS7812306.1 hypothetical protein [Roseococcus pinisoli]